MIENYTRLSSRMFTATVVGKDKNGRKITEGRETYKTPSGVYEIKDWARLVEKAAEADGLLPVAGTNKTPCKGIRMDEKRQRHKCADFSG